jgi:hypothetical protein
MNERINFGDLDFNLGDKITFLPQPEIDFEVASAKGGTLVRYSDGRVDSDVNEEVLYAIRLLTRRLMGDDFSDDLDIYELWTYQDKTLRAIYLEKINA